MFLHLSNYHIIVWVQSSLFHFLNSALFRCHKRNMTFKSDILLSLSRLCVSKKCSIIYKMLFCCSQKLLINKTKWKYPHIVLIFLSLIMVTNLPAGFNKLVSCLYEYSCMDIITFVHLCRLFYDLVLNYASQLNV